MKIGIIGAGKVGFTVGKYLSEKGDILPLDIEITGYYSRTETSAREAADFTGSAAFGDLNDLVRASDTLFITTPDGVIASVWDCIDKSEIKSKVICHFSGSLSSNVFSGIEDAGAYGCSIHPMYAFSDRFSSYKKFDTAFITLEGDEQALVVFEEMFQKLGHKTARIDAKNKIKYHAAAALASNYMVGLFAVALDLLVECGFEKSQAEELLAPLVRNNVAAMLEKGCESALTGPVERCDKDTVIKHIAALKGTKTEDIYMSLGRELIELAQRKNPDRDYTALKEVL